jgi:hypothetical protein
VAISRLIISVSRRDGLRWPPPFPVIAASSSATTMAKVSGHFTDWSILPIPHTHQSQHSQASISMNIVETLRSIPLYPHYYLATWTSTLITVCTGSAVTLLAAYVYLFHVRNGNSSFNNLPGEPPIRDVADSHRTTSRSLVLG